jgi:hypothetical protein
MPVSTLRTLFTFVWLGSIAGLQRSELINVVFDITTLTASTITLSHIVFISTTPVVIVFVCQKEEAQIYFFLA